MAEEVYRQIVDLKRKGQKAALATVIETGGSTPARAGAKMLVLEQGGTLGSIIGSVGGGCLEAEVYQTAQRVIRGRKPEILQFTLTDDLLEKEGHMCGGRLRVFIEPL